MVKLILKLKETQIEEFALEKDQIIIGRAKENDIVIDNIAVSRKHAQITRKEDGLCYIRDLNSSNGTFLNGAQIDASDHALSEGAMIGIAKFELQVKGLSKAAPASPKPATPEDAEGTMIFDPGPAQAGGRAPDGLRAQDRSLAGALRVEGSRQGGGIQNHQRSDPGGQRLPGRYSRGRMVRLLPPRQDHPPGRPFLHLPHGRTPV